MFQRDWCAGPRHESICKRATLEVTMNPQPPAPAPPDAAHPPAPIDLSEESIAGEEDPGASLDLGEVEPAPENKPAPRDGSR